MLAAWAALCFHIRVSSARNSAFLFLPSNVPSQMLSGRPSKDSDYRWPFHCWFWSGLDSGLGLWRIHASSLSPIVSFWNKTAKLSTSPPRASWPDSTHGSCCNNLNVYCLWSSTFVFTSFVQVADLCATSRAPRPNDLFSTNYPRPPSQSDALVRFRFVYLLLCRGIFLFCANTYSASKTRNHRSFVVIEFEQQNQCLLSSAVQSISQFGW